MGRELPRQKSPFYCAVSCVEARCVVLALTWRMELSKDVLCGGVSTATVSAFLNPVDVVKTRRQLERFSERRALDIASTLWAEGGVVALWSPGLAATVAREMLYSDSRPSSRAISRSAPPSEE